MIDGQASVCHRLGVDLSGCRWPVRHVGFHSQHRRETHLSPNFAPSSPSPFPCCKIGHLLTKSKQTCSFRSPCTPDVTSPAVCQFTLSSCHAESVTYSNNSGQQHRTHRISPNTPHSPTVSPHSCPHRLGALLFSLDPAEYLHPRPHCRPAAASTTTIRTRDCDAP
jgi:hypothetical protein